MHVKFFDGTSKCLGKGFIFIALSNGYGKTVSNLKVLDSIPTLSYFRVLFISSHSGLTGVNVGSPNPDAPGARYVSDWASEYE